MAYRLGIDFGTSNTVAVVHQPDGRSRVVLFDGFPLLPSSVCVSLDGSELLVGREAAHSARVHPERFEPYPKRLIDEGTVLLGTAEYPVPQLIAAVLGRVRAEVVRMMGGEPAEVVLTYPAAWAAPRQSVLLDAARRAGLGRPELVAEPVAAATYFVDVTEVDVPVGDCVVVYDFGAGTFDASVVRRTAGGWEILASAGLPDAGGLDVDATIVAYIAATYTSSRPDEVRRLETPDSAGDRRAKRLLWEDVRTAKEILSRSSATYIHLPLIEDDAPLGREQLERLARPVVDRTVALTRNLIAGAVADGRLAGVFLVGGSSRMPLVATLLHRAIHVSPTAIEQPELVVAEGSARDRSHPTVPSTAPTPAMAFTLPATDPEPVRPPEPDIATPAAPEPAPQPESGPRPPEPEPVTARRPIRGALLCAVVALIALVFLTVFPKTHDDSAFDYWERLLSWPTVLLMFGYVAWLAYRYADPDAPRVLGGVVPHALLLTAVTAGTFQAADAVVSDVNSTLLFTVVFGLAVLAGVAAIWPRRSGRSAHRPVLGAADAGIAVVAAVVYGFANSAMDGPGGNLPPSSAGGYGQLAVALATTTLALVGLGAALGVLTARRRPAAIPALRVTAGVLLLAAGAIVGLVVAGHIFG